MNLGESLADKVDEGTQLHAMAADISDEASCARQTHALNGQHRTLYMTDLFNDFDLKGLPLANRIVMSAMTRTRATENDVPTDLMRDYYVQRASAGLIVTECTQVSDQGHGIIRCPGIHRQDQIAGWRRVTDAVHVAGGRIYLQIWHCGRVAHPDMRGGERPVGPSPIPATGEFFLPSGRV
jgi:N-ethylmaleimide reductase